MATADLTAIVTRSKECLAFDSLDVVLGKAPDAPNERRETYHVRLLSPGDMLIRLYFVPKFGGHPVPDTATEFRPDCECMNFQVQGLDTDGKWTKHVCKHIVAKTVVMLKSVTATPGEKMPWANLLADILPRVQAPENHVLQTLLHTNLPVSTF